MTLVVDVGFQEFKKAGRRYSAFFWMEDKSKFVLIRPFQQGVLRTVVKKDRGESDFAFRLRELSSSSAVRVHGIHFDSGGRSKVKEDVEELLETSI